MQVRANSLQELVYKQGQAGITKATVSIVFDNHDKERSPVGYEHMDEITVTRQLVIGGRSKYLINGKVAEPTYALPLPALDLHAQLHLLLCKCHSIPHLLPSPTAGASRTCFTPCSSMSTTPTS